MPFLSLAAVPVAPLRHTAGGLLTGDRQAVPEGRADSAEKLRLLKRTAKVLPFALRPVKLKNPLRAIWAGFRLKSAVDPAQSGVLIRAGP